MRLGAALSAICLATFRAAGQHEVVVQPAGATTAATLDPEAQRQSSAYSKCHVVFSVISFFKVWVIFVILTLSTLCVNLTIFYKEKNLKFNYFF